MGEVELKPCEKLIKQLSKPLCRAILALDDQCFTDWSRVLRQRPQRIKLVALGLTEPERRGPITLWFNIRLTQLGKEVQRLLAEPPAKP